MNPSLSLEPGLYITAARAVRTVPAILALAYPLLLRLGPAGVLPALAMPFLALYFAAQFAADGRYPRARLIAHAAFAAPPLFTFLGGLFDFQSSLPVSSFGVWIPLWLSAIALVWNEAPAIPITDPKHSLGLAKAHGFSALGITIFATAHIANHLAGIYSGELHIRIMDALRTVYRIPLIEIALFALIAFQIVSGSMLLVPRLRFVGDAYSTWQTASAAYLTAFFFSHSYAVLGTRYARHVDTNWTWLTSTPLLSDPWMIRLVPYYFLVVVVFGLHGGLGLRTVLLAHGYSPRLGKSVVVTAGILSVLVSGAILSALLAG